HLLEALEVLARGAGVTDPGPLCAVVLHDVVEDTACTVAQVAEGFGPRVAELVGWVTIPPPAAGQDKAAAKEAYLRGVGGAPRDAILVKLPDRASNGQTLRNLPPARQRAYYAQTVEHIVPLADTEPWFRYWYASWRAEFADLATPGPGGADGSAGSPGAAAGSAGAAGAARPLRGTSRPANRPPRDTKQPNPVAGARPNIAVSAMIRRQTAAGRLRGGRNARLAMTARPASASSATAIRWPVGPVSASRRPGSGLAASDLTWVRPSGNAIVFCTRDRGPRAATGPTTAATITSAVAAMLAAARRPSLATSRITATTSAGHAVAFIAAAAPNASPASTGLRRHSRANPT